jgi:glycosyltransferase involved in cell wall biosynthesis
MAVLTHGPKTSIDHDTLVNDERIVSSYINELPIFREKVSTKIGTKKTGLAISVFLNNIYDNLTVLEKYNIPFIFTLYPGGGFALNDFDSDRKLIEVFSSKLFRRVIVTQKITYEYLINNKLCPEDKIEYIYGGVVDNYILNLNRLHKKRYGRDKESLDICFVGHKYTTKGIDKGYDIFIDFAKIISKKYKNIKFHIVGDFTEEDINIDEIKNKIKFYGTKESTWFKDFYFDKDIIISPNRPFILSDGSFDGFPLTCSAEAMLNQVALFCSDELNLNTQFTDEKDLVIVRNNAKDISKVIEYYYNKPDKIKLISEQGFQAAKHIYSYRSQIKPRVKIIKNELKKIKKERKAHE